MAAGPFPLLQNIRAQPETLRQALAYHGGEGLPALQAAARAIRGARRVVLTASGASYCAAIPLATALATAGIDATLIEAAELLHYGHTPFGAGTLVVLVSRSGASVEIVRLLSLLRRQGASLIGVTDERESVLGQEADTVLWVAGRPDQMVAVQSYTATLLLFHLLAQAVVDAPAGDAERAAEEAIAAMERALPAWEDAGDSWRDFLTGGAPLYLLGRGSALASASAGALLFHEVAKQPAVAMNAGAFRHGPVEVVDAGFRAIVVAPPDGTQSLNLALAEELSRLGGQVRLLGPRPPAAPLPPASWWEVVLVSPLLLPLLEIVPLQLAALRLAVWGGVVPGSFRVLEQVIRSETTLRPG